MEDVETIHEEAADCETVHEETPCETIHEEMVQEEAAAAADGPAPLPSLHSSPYVEMIDSRISAFCIICCTVMCVKCMLY